jgi:hypothetical protein
MKNTIASVALFVLLTFVFSDSALAFTIPNIRVKPSVIPTPIILKKVEPNVNLQLIPTIAPAAKLTVTPEPTLGTKLTVTPEPTLGTKLTVTPNQEKTELSPTQEATKTEEMVENKPDLKTWFMGITMGLLALIIIIQLLPKKKAGQ